MTISRREILLPAALAALAAGPARAEPGAAPLLVDLDRAPDETIALWPDGAPGATRQSLKERIVERDNPFGLVDRAAYEVTHPVLDIFRAREPHGEALLIIPGGGYGWVVIDKEGYEGARYFSRRGATVYVLRYRLPHQGWTAGADAPLQDAQRAARIVRSRAPMDGARADRLTVMGFSAGGHLAGSLALRFDAPTYDAVDSADRLSARPDFAALLYPVVTMQAEITHAKSRANLIGANPGPDAIERYSLERRVRADAPPVFILHASDDEAVPVGNALLLYAALQKARVPAALHVFTRGGHGFGLRGIDDDPLGRWPDLFLDWLAAARAQ